MQFKRRVGLTGFCALFLFLYQITEIHAQVQDPHWTDPYRLSSIEGSYKHRSNVMAADEYGYVHVMWIEEGVEKYSLIQYSQFDGTKWTEPIDIYATKSPLDRLYLSIDTRNNLHLAWSEGSSYRQFPVYYSTAPAYDAFSAQQWSVPSLMVLGVFQFGLQMDPEGDLHLLYSKFFGMEAGVYYMKSPDEGVTWTEPIWLDPDIPPNQGPEALQFGIDQTNTLHATWYYSPIDDLGGDLIRYSRSVDDGQSWSMPFTVDANQGVDGKLKSPDPMMIVQDETVHVVWGADTGNHIQRWHRYSSDSGQSWTQPVQIFDHLVGQAFDGLAVDGAGRLHYSGQIRWPQGIYHAYWDQNRWMRLSLVYLIAQDSNDSHEGRYHVHSVRLVFRAGNQLVSTFYDRREEPPYVLYAMHRTFDDIAGMPAIATPSAIPTSVSTSIPTPTGIITAESSVPRPPLNVQDTMSSPVTATSPGTTIMISVAPLMLLFATLAVWQLLQKNRRV